MLEARELLRFGPFDASPCTGATLDDLDFGRMSLFIRTVRRARQFPLPEGTPPEALLRHMNLLNKGRLTNAAVLLFGKAPQRFLISSEVKCAHFHATEVAKPIPFYQVYKGTVFALADQAVDFVLSKIALSVGTRAESVQARMGTGTVDMIRRCAEAGLPEPEFVASGGFVTTIRRAGYTAQPVGTQVREPASGLIGTMAAGQDPKPFLGTAQETTQERILALLREDPRLTRRGLAARIGITPDGIKYHLAKLRKAGRIRHVGATKKGRWEVIDDR